VFILRYKHSLEVEKRGGAGKGNWGVVTDTAE
jgi:hypothetical protein